MSIGTRYTKQEVEQLTLLLHLPRPAQEDGVRAMVTENPTRNFNGLYQKLCELARAEREQYRIRKEVEASLQPKVAEAVVPLPETSNKVMQLLQLITSSGVNVVEVKVSNNELYVKF